MTGQEQTENQIQCEASADSLIEIANKYKLLTENMRDVIWQVTPDLVITYISASNTRLTGYDSHEVIGRPIWDFLAQTSSEHVRNRFVKRKRYLADKGKLDSETYEVEQIRKDGTTVWTEMVSNPIFDNAGRLVGFQGVTRDVTERKRVEEVLRQSEDKFSKSFLLSPDAISITRLVDRVLVSVNKGFEELFGYAEEEVIGKTSLELEIWDDPEDRNRAVEGLLSEGKVRNFEARFRAKNGGTVYGNMSAAIIVLNGVQHILSIVRDTTDRKRAEEDLRESENRLSNYLNSINEMGLGVFVVDQNYKVRHMNPTMVRWFGDHLGKVCYESVAGLSDPCPYCQLDKVITESKVVHYEPSTPDGRTFSIVAAPVKENDGSISKMEIISDITEHKKTEQERDRLFNLSSDMLCVAGYDGFFKQVNPAWNKSLGWSSEELTSKPWIEFVHPDDRSGTLLAAERLERELRLVSWENRYLHKDGGYRWFSCNVTALPDERLCFSVIRDITEQKRVQSALIDSEKKFRDLAGLLPQAVFEIDTAGKYTFVNSATSKLTGYSLEEFLTVLNAVQLFIQEDQERVANKIKEIIAGQELVHQELVAGAYTVLKKDGSTVPVLIYAARISRDQKIVGIRGVVVDISTLKQAEEEREKLRTQLFQSQKIEALGTLVGGIAHDFNNMLQIMLGYSQFLLDDKKKGEPGYKELQTIIETGQGGAELVKKLLAFGQQGQVFPVSLNLNHQINQLTSLISRTLPQVVQVDLDLADGPTTIRADHGQIDQLVMNLAINAAEAMPNGGRLKIATKTVSLDDEYCRTHHGAKPGNYVMLSVSDTGRGMDQETLAKVFDPFFSTKERGSTRGTGLGLSVVKGIVQQQGGHVTCESEPGKGSEFKVYFPFIEAIAVTAKTVMAPVQSGGAEKILVVEDNIPVAELEKRILESAGYSVIVTNSGQEALDVYSTRREDISLVILDLLMPEMSGRDCLMELVKLDPTVKVLVASGYALEDVLHREISSLVKGFVHKPFAIAELIKEARSALDSDYTEQFSS